MFIVVFVWAIPNKTLKLNPLKYPIVTLVKPFKKRAEPHPTEFIEPSPENETPS